MKKKKTAYVGIDPGLTGCAAMWSETNRVWFHDFSSPRRACEILKAWSTTFDLRVVIEDPVTVPARFGKDAQKKLNRNYGQWIGILIALNIDHLCVAPSDWQSIKLKANKKQKTNAKALSIESAKQLIPGCENYVSKVKDHNRADALLLAYYSRRVHDLARRRMQ